MILKIFESGSNGYYELSAHNCRNIVDSLKANYKLSNRTFDWQHFHNWKHAFAAVLLVAALSLQVWQTGSNKRQHESST